MKATQQYISIKLFGFVLNIPRGVVKHKEKTLHPQNIFSWSCMASVQKLFTRKPYHILWQYHDLENILKIRKA